MTRPIRAGARVSAEPKRRERTDKPGEPSSESRRATRRFLALYAEERGAIARAISGVEREDDRQRETARLLIFLLGLRFLEAGGLAGAVEVVRQRLYASRSTDATAASGISITDLLDPARDPHDVGVDRAAALAHLRGCLATLDASPPTASTARIAPDAVRRLLDRLDDYQWSVDERPGETAGSVLTPAILGQALEQRQGIHGTGVHYTASDVTGYITRYTALTALLDRVGAVHPQAFGPNGEFWRPLREAPDAYITSAMRWGTDVSLPPHITAGLADLACRDMWNEPAPPAYALPGETWRDHLARRAHYEHTRDRLAHSTQRTVSDLITYTMDIERFVSDAVACASPALTLAFWRALNALTLVDPTCGAGAFLVRALGILAPIFHTCIARMQTLSVKLKSSEYDDGSDMRTLDLLESALEEVEAAGDAWAYATRHLIEHTLHGMDVDREAVAVARLRLLLAPLALLANARPLTTSPPLRFNILAGDALQSNGERHQPVGGFDAAIGNPPYVRTRPRDAASGDLQRYRTRSTGNLYAMVVERALELLWPGGRMGMIVPVASVATAGMSSLQHLYHGHSQWHSHYATRPGKLFPQVDMNLTITLLQKDQSGGPRYSTSYQRWRTARPSARDHLFQRLAYMKLPEDARLASQYPKIGTRLEADLLARMLAHGHFLADYSEPRGIAVYYHSGGRYWRKALPVRLSSHYRELRVSPETVATAGCLLSSQLFYWWWIVNSNCMDVVSRDVLRLPVFDIESDRTPDFRHLWSSLQAALNADARARVRRGARIATDEVNFDLARCKPLIDEIDRMLATCYGFSGEQVDFILNYDVTYRLRQRI